MDLKNVSARGVGAVIAGLVLLLVGVVALGGTAGDAAQRDGEESEGRDIPERVSGAEVAAVVPLPRDTAAAAAAAEPMKQLPPPLGAPGTDWERVPRAPKPDAVHGIYVNAWAAGAESKLAELLRLADRTEVNSFVVDVKDATGYVSYWTTVPLARRIGAHEQVRIGDIREVLAELREHGVYPIARIVVFKDPLLAKARPELAIQNEDGSVWHDQHGVAWVDAFNKEVWDYAIALAREAAALGFAEIQWDYVRFPDVPSRYMENAVFPARDGRTKSQAIRQFLEYSQKKLADLDVPVTADVFGVTVVAPGGVGIGQDWDLLTPIADVLLPMIYPSHWQRGAFGIRHPNARPYEIVKTAMERAVARNRGVESAATIRPWLQDFTLGEPAYGPAHVRAQIQAVYDAGLSSWVLWNAASNYTVAALAPEGGPPPEYPLPREGGLWLPYPEIELLGSPVASTR